MKHDFEMGFGLVIGTIILSIAHPFMLVAAVAAIANHLHQRHVAYHAGEPFERRVKEALTEELSKFDAMLGHEMSEAQERLEKMEKAVEDVKEAQVRIAGAWRGRAHP